MGSRRLGSGGPLALKQNRLNKRRKTWGAIHARRKGREKGSRSSSRAYYKQSRTLKRGFIRK